MSALMQALETRSIEQLPSSTAVSPNALMAIQEPDGPATSVPVKRLLGRLISTEEATETEDDLQALLDYDANSIALVFADPTAAKNGWYRKTGALGAGNWVQFETLSANAAAEVAVLVGEAEAAATAAAASAALIYTDAFNNVGQGSGGGGGWSGPGLSGANDNTWAGVDALGSAQDAVRCTNFGRAAGRGGIDSADEVNIGYAAGLLNPSGLYNTRVGSGANGNSTSIVNYLTALGGLALANCAANDAVGVGYGSGTALTTGIRFTAVGTGSATSHTIEDAISAFGWGAGTGEGQVFGFNNQTMLGAASYCTWENQVCLGDDQVAELRVFGAIWARQYAFADVIIGQNAGNRGADGGARVIIGYEAAVRPNTVTDERAIYIGYLNGNAALNNRAFVSIGSNASQYAENNVDVTVVGDQAGRWLGRAMPTIFEDAVNDPIHLLAAGADLTNGLPTPAIMVGHCFFGKNAGRYNSIGQNNTGLGDSALGFTLTGSFNVAVGYVCGEGNVHGSRNTWAGQGIRVYVYSGDDNAQIGFGIGEGIGAFGNWVSGGSRNANLGAQAVHKWRGDDVASLGYRTFFLMNAGAGGDVGIGTLAGATIITGGNNIFIGNGAGNHEDQAANVQNSIVIGAGAYSTAPNQVVIGNAANDNFKFGTVEFSTAELVALKELAA